MKGTGGATYTTVDLFAGCGGLTEGLRQTRHFRAVAAVELDPAAAATYALNHTTRRTRSIVYPGLIQDWLAAGQLPVADVVVGGPPCQGFSQLGTQDPNDPRNALWRSYVEAVQRISPKVFVLENVPAFLRSRQFAQLQLQTRSGAALEDYVLEHEVVNAADHGTAQARRRALVIGRHKSMSPLGALPTTNPRPTLWDVLHDVPRRVDTVDLPADRWETVLGHEVRGSYKSIELHVTRNPTDRSKERYKHIPPGGNRHKLPPHLSSPGWLRHRTGSGDVMGRLVWDKPCVTIRTEFFKPEKGRYLHPEQHRALTHYEAALIQGFPDDYVWCGTKIEIARQIGNAVPVPLGAAIGTYIAGALDASADLEVSRRTHRG
jgi:DNA (cytosine-5)-methyltransferase 1